MILTWSMPKTYLKYFDEIVTDENKKRIFKYNLVESGDLSKWEVSVKRKTNFNRQGLSITATKFVSGVSVCIKVDSRFCRSAVLSLNGQLGISNKLLTEFSIVTEIVELSLKHMSAKTGW